MKLSAAGVGWAKKKRNELIKLL